MFRIKSRILFFLIVSILSVNSYAQSVNHIDHELKSIFFNLDVDTCQSELIKQIDSNKTYKFKYLDGFDTLRFMGEFTIDRRKFIAQSYQIESKNLGWFKCDTLKIVVQPANIYRMSSHTNEDSKRFYGHIISINLYFLDSLKAVDSYNKIVDSISKRLKLPYNQGDYTSDGKIEGKVADFSIDKKNNGYEYERKLSVWLNSYQKLYEVKIEFERLTFNPEGCD